MNQLLIFAVYLSSVFGFQGQGTPDVAGLELPAIFGDHMVLQADGPIAVWGRGQPGERIEVSLAHQHAQATVDPAGNWSLDIAPVASGGPHRLLVTGGAAGKVDEQRSLAFEDVLVGQVWFGSGQSNMRMTAEYSAGYEEARATADIPELRVFREESLPAQEPMWRGEGKWIVCTPDSFGNFSGVLFRFGVALHSELNAPIGLIDASIGGTQIELWTSADAQFEHPDLASHATRMDGDFWAFDAHDFLVAYRACKRVWATAVAQAREQGTEVPNRPPNLAEIHFRHGSVGHLFNGKVHPLIPYSISGIIWYQGESNVFHAPLYGLQLRTLVTDLRKRWNQPRLPFVWVQLPNFDDGREEAEWERVREEMRRSLCLENTGMAITIDAGESHDIHPFDKTPVGQRLARWAFTQVYGYPGTPSGPLYKSHHITNNQVRVTFEHAQRGLLPTKSDLPGFELAGPNHQWQPARATVSGNDVIVQSSLVPNPLHVRYAWDDDPLTNLRNQASLPTSPFTTALLSNCENPERLTSFAKRAEDVSKSTGQ